MSGWKDAPLGDETHPTDPTAVDADALCLLVLGQEAGGGVFALPTHGKVTVGRGPLCEVFVPAPTMSRTHAALEMGPPLRVRDLDSANGVVVRGRRLTPGESVVVAPGDVIEFGSVVAVVQRRAMRTGAMHPPREPVVRATHTMPPPATALGEGTKRADAFVVREPAMVRIFELIQRVGPSDLSVLVLGETGVGKEIIAESVHRASARAAGPFVRLNCAALSPTLLESELFGHEKGSFTGAMAAKPGLLESADGGTVFLDEAGELPMAVQVKLLRVLEERMVQRVGALRPRAIDVRFVAATHRDLRDAIAHGTFRQDLYYRLDGITIELPPLRARVSEIEPLARHFAQRVALKSGRPASDFTLDALSLLRAYAWPGNVRELRNVIERAVLLAGHDPIDRTHLPGELARGAIAPALATTTASDPSSVLRSEVGAFERQRIIDALARCGGNQTRAAEVLGVSRRTLVTKLKLYDIPRR